MSEGNTNGGVRLTGQKTCVVHPPPNNQTHAHTYTVTATTTRSLSLMYLQVDVLQVRTELGHHCEVAIRNGAHVAKVEHLNFATAVEQSVQHPRLEPVALSEVNLSQLRARMADRFECCACRCSTCVRVCLLCAHCQWRDMCVLCVHCQWRERC